MSMIVSTTPSLEGRSVENYLGIVTGEAIMGADLLKDLFASFRDLMGGRSKAYEEEMEKARAVALEEMISKAANIGANAVLGVNIDYETITSDSGSMMMVCVSGTAVQVR